MPVLIAAKLKKPSQVHFSQYIRTENKPEEAPTNTPEPKEEPKASTK